jgi:hypothetical protein
MTQIPHLSAIKKIFLDKVSHHVAFEIAPDAPFIANNWEVVVEQVARRLVFHLKAAALGKNIENVDIEEKWPQDWWQAFRERWFPAWWLNRWPVKYKRISVHKAIYRICPHLNMATDKNSMGLHLQWLEDETMPAWFDRYHNIAKTVRKQIGEALDQGRLSPHELIEESRRP